MKRSVAAALLGRFVLCWVLVGGFFYICGAFIIQGVLPLLQWVANGMSADYQAQLSMSGGGNGTIINIVATLTSNIYQYNYPIAPKGTVLRAAGTLVHALTPLVILFSILIAWPGSLRAIILRGLLGLPAGLIILTLSLPFLLVGHIEGRLFSALQNIADREMPMPAIMQWVMFMEMGGLWLLPIVCAIGCVAITQHLLNLLDCASINSLSNQHDAPPINRQQNRSS